MGERYVMTEVGAEIYHFWDLVPAVLCDLIVERLKDKKGRGVLKFEEAARHPGIKGVWDCFRSSDVAGVEELKGLIVEAANRMLKVYRDLRVEGHEIKDLSLKESYPFLRFIRYSKGADMKSHFDFLKGDRVVSTLCYLNDGYEGGDLYYPKQGVCLKPRKGDIVIHPSIYTHPHISQLIVEGEKFVCLSVFGLAD